MYATWYLLSFILWASFSSTIVAESIVAVIDPNSTGIPVRTEQTVKSICTILSVPKLEIMDRVVFGENVGAAMIHHDVLMLTGQSMETSDVRTPESFQTGQIFAFFSLAPFRQIERSSASGYLLASDPFFPQPTAPMLAGGVSRAAAIIQYIDNLSVPRNIEQQVVGFSDAGKAVFKYTIPESERSLTKIHALDGDQWLLEVTHPGADSRTTLKILDGDSDSIVKSILLDDHVRQIIPNVDFSESCFALLDKPEAGQIIRLGQIKCQPNDINVESIELPFHLDQPDETVLTGVALDGRQVLLGVGFIADPYAGLKQIYLVDYIARTARLILAIKQGCSSFTVTSDHKYLITVGSSRPQVAIYDLNSYSLLGVQESVSRHPIRALTN